MSIVGEVNRLIGWVGRASRTPVGRTILENPEAGVKEIARRVAEQAITRNLPELLAARELEAALRKVASNLSLALWLIRNGQREAGQGILAKIVIELEEGFGCQAQMTSSSGQPSESGT